jgi:hypothetical protein
VNVLRTSSRSSSEPSSRSSSRSSPGQLRGSHEACALLCARRLVGTLRRSEGGFGARWLRAPRAVCSGGGAGPFGSPRTRPRTRRVGCKLWQAGADRGVGMDDSGVPLRDLLPVPMDAPLRESSPGRAYVTDPEHTPFQPAVDVRARLHGYRGPLYVPLPAPLASSMGRPGYHTQSSCCWEMGLLIGGLQSVSRAAQSDPGAVWLGYPSSSQKASMRTARMRRADRNNHEQRGVRQREPVLQPRDDR